MTNRKRSLTLILLLAFILIVCSSAWAETIRLKNGRIFDGIVADESDGEVKVVMKSGVVIFSRDEIDSIDGRKLTPPLPVKKPVMKKTVLSTTVASTPVKKKQQKWEVKFNPPGKDAQPASLPTVATGTTTFTQFAASTNTAAAADSAHLTPPNPLPAKSKKGASLNAIADIIIIATVLITIVIVLIKKRIKKQPKDI